MRQITFQVVLHRLPRHVGGHLLPPVLVVGVVRVLKVALLGHVHEQVAVEPAVDDLPVAVGPRPPVEVPLAAVLPLLLVADQVQPCLRAGLQVLLGLGIETWSRYQDGATSIVENTW